MHNSLEPFDHEAVMHHARSGSSANLLQSDSSTRDSDTENLSANDAFYDPNAKGAQNLYDKPEVDYSYDPVSRRQTQNYHDLGPQVLDFYHNAALMNVLV